MSHEQGDESEDPTEGVGRVHPLEGADARAGAGGGIPSGETDEKKSGGDYDDGQPTSFTWGCPGICASRASGTEVA